MASPPFDRLQQASPPPYVVPDEAVADHDANASRVRQLCQAIAHNFDHRHYVDSKWLHEVARRLGFNTFGIEEDVTSDPQWLADLNNQKREPMSDRVRAWADTNAATALNMKTALSENFPFLTTTETAFMLSKIGEAWMEVIDHRKAGR